MKPALAFLLAFPFLVSTVHAAETGLEQIEKEQQALFDSLAPKVIFIASQDGLGSGFFVNAQGLALTSAHVVQNRKQVDVVLHDGRKARGKVVELAKDDVDLALVQVTVDHTPAVDFAPSETIRIGSWIAAIGHALGGAWTFTHGMITNIYPSGQDRSILQTQIPINPGNSGGPVFNRRGLVVGVVTATLKNASNMNFAIRMDKACETLAGLAAKRQAVTVLAPPNTPIFVDGKMVGSGPRAAVPVKPGIHEAFIVVKGQMRKQRFTYPATTQVDLSQAE